MVHTQSLAGLILLDRSGATGFLKKIMSCAAAEHQKTNLFATAPMLLSGLKDE